jgi:uncharacterized protein DUF4126
LIAVAAMGHASRETEVLIALVGGALAAGTHLTKAGTRVVANTSPEPFSNWILSISEDGFVVALALLALKFPLATALVVIALVVMMLVVAAWLVGKVRRGFRARSPNPESRSLRSTP